MKGPVAVKKAPPKKAAPPPPPPRRYKSVTTIVDGVTLRSHPFAELKAGQMKRLYAMLLEKRGQIRASRQQRLDEAISNVDSLADDIDIAQRHTEQASLMRFADKERKLLGEIDRALEKLIDRAEYGVCEGTEEPISLKRLEVRPWTRYSVAHKEQIERDRKQHRR
ncbi:MAG: TraR/DksA family transcriptional regulator [Deltaproteobacteria bacterium]|nr:TraR/DksA family transcriptional regulator [Deltaproteobacteria bacterium]